MSEHQDNFLSRRHWLVLAASTLSACGGGGSLTALLPGTGGTGIFAQGSISGFGSVIINGIRFDDSAASVQLDGVTRHAADLRLGMMATVEGERGLDPALGTAHAIEVWSLAQGLVTSVNAAASEFSVAGMTVQTDANTVFDGLTNATALRLNQRVSVWGLQAATLPAGTTGGNWLATRVALTTDPTLVSTGLVGMSNQQPYLSGLILTGAKAAQLSAGQLVRVQGQLHASGMSLSADSISLRGAAQAIADTHAAGEIEIEALVTAVSSATRFTMDGMEVDASAASIDPLGSRIAVGDRLEVEGTWRSGLLVATQVEVKNKQTSQVIEIKAAIEQFTSLANFVVRGQVCDASAVTAISHGKLTDLQVGTKIKLKGTQAGNVLIVTELELDD